MKLIVKLLVFCMISCWSTELSAQLYEPPGYTQPGVTIASILAICKSELNRITNETKVILYTKNGEKTLEYKDGEGGVVHIEPDMLDDSMRIIVEVKGYKKTEVVYHKSYGLRLALHLSPIDYFANEIIVKGDRIEVTINKKTTIYDATQLRQSKEEDIFQTLFKLPGFKFDGKSVKIDGNTLDYIYINNKYYYRFNEDSSTYVEIIQKLKKAQKSKKSKR